MLRLFYKNVLIGTVEEKSSDFPNHIGVLMTEKLPENTEADGWYFLTKDNKKIPIRKPKISPEIRIIWRLDIK